MAPPLTATSPRRTDPVASYNAVEETAPEATTTSAPGAVEPEEVDGAPAGRPSAESAAFARRRADASEQLMRMHLLQQAGPASRLTAELEDGVLTVQGTDAADEITLTREGDDYVLYPYGGSQPLGRFAVSEVDEIRVATFGADDIIDNRIEGEGPAITIAPGAGFDIIANHSDNAVIQGNAEPGPDGTPRLRDVDYLTNYGDNLLLDDQGASQWDVTQLGNDGFIRLEGGGVATVNGDGNEIVGPEGLAVNDAGSDNRFTPSDSDALAPGAPASSGGWASKVIDFVRGLFSFLGS